MSPCVLAPSDSELRSWENGENINESKRACLGTQSWINVSESRKDPERRSGRERGEKRRGLRREYRHGKSSTFILKRKSTHFVLVWRLISFI